MQIREPKELKQTMSGSCSDNSSDSVVARAGIPSSGVADPTVKRVDTFTLCCKVVFIVNSEWAAQRLGEIQTLMERSTLYRRALAPTTTLTGCMGMAAAWLGWSMPIREGRPFCLFWMATSLCCLILAGLMVRRQAWVAEESFWSPPTRRVAMAMLPALCCGGGLGMLAVTQENLPEIFLLGPAPLWMLFMDVHFSQLGFSCHVASNFWQSLRNDRAAPAQQGCFGIGRRSAALHGTCTHHHGMLFWLHALRLRHLSVHD